MSEHPSPAGHRPPRAGLRRARPHLAVAILAGEISVDEAIERAAAHLLSDARVEVVVAALTTFAPEDPTGWARLGGRAWVREWSRPGPASHRCRRPAPAPRQR